MKILILCYLFCIMFKILRIILKNIDFAIERGFRLFQKGIENFHFFMIQIKINKLLVPAGEYLFLLKDRSLNIVYQKRIRVDNIKKRIITPQSHEDPLVEDENCYMICFQLEEKEINNFNEILCLHFQNEYKKDLIEPERLPNLKNVFDYHFNKYSNVIEDYYLISKKDCILRLHLGGEDGSYNEKEYILKAEEKFNFKPFLSYPYLGVQCSYENESPEIEEKHIIVGQKAMTISGVYFKNYYYEALLPFNRKYQILYYEDSNKLDNESNLFFTKKNELWTEVNNINELINFYDEKQINFFEIDINFILPQYKKKLTYGLNKVIKLQKEEYKPKKFHTDLEICKNCNYASKCIQIVPSNLSSELFRENLYLEEKNECKIYQLIQKKLIF